MKPATEILLSAAFALTPEGNWTRESLARDALGNGVSLKDPKAASWCALGAVSEAADDRGLEFEAWEFFERAVGTDGVDFNNTSTHAKVLAALYKAAELSEAS